MGIGNDSALHSSGKIYYNEEFSFDHGNVMQVTVAKTYSV